jgi:Tfp pilus assembly protein PilO
MKITSRWAAWKIWVAAGIGVLVVADIVFAVALFQTLREAPEQMAAQRNQLAATSRQLEADVARVEKIRGELGRVGQNSDEFYNSTFLDSRTVYSTVDSDLLAIANKAGVKTTGFTFKQTNIADRHVAELDINTTVDGDYASLLQFVNGIERSKNFYFLNQLQLASSGPGGIRLEVQLHTFCRT